MMAAIPVCLLFKRRVDIGSEKHDISLMTSR
jgi:hypothetical protein